MKTRRLGSTDLEFTTIGLGTWAIGGPWEVGWGPQDDSQAIRAIITAIDECGINWIDTAPIYGCGHSEHLVGIALRQMRSRPLIATKCGMLWNERKERVFCLEPQSIRNECYDSLRRLGIDVIDLYQIHRPIPEEKIEWAWEELTRLKDKGLVRHIGVSNFTIEQMERIAKIHPVESLQPQYNMLHRQIEQEVLAYCKENQIGVITYSPLARGLLIGKFTKENLSDLAPDDHRLRIDDFKEPQFSATLQMVENLRPVARQLGITLAQLAIAWVLRRPEITSAIVGARSPDQIRQTAPAGNVELPPEVVDQIEQIIQQRQRLVGTGKD
ncbi:MAG: aldo/keto reductase [Sedimentisphaerales bacterium]|jgi:aryl-alcohol dehydrogenase-like predicted oxidoreductase|nr:aldo/keto reductase [Sedimentisphaerales bacterium]